MSNISSKLPSWVMLVIFLAILAILAIFGDLFTFLVGTFIMIMVFANNYDRVNGDHH